MSRLSADELIGTVESLYRELHGYEARALQINLDSHLERDLGFDSLVRVELLARLEQRYGIRPGEKALEQIERVGDVLRLASSVSEAPAPEVGTPGPPTGPTPAFRTDPSLALQSPREATTLVQMLAWHVQRHPEAVHALLLENAGARTVTYAELWQAAQIVAGNLRRAGIREGMTIALMLPTSFEYLCTFFGVLLAGAVPVPMYPPTRPSQLEEHVHRHVEILSNCAAAALVTFHDARAVGRLLKMRVPGLEHLWSAAELGTRGVAETAELPAVTASSLAMLQYTSGSTGSPKGVMLTHTQLLANIRAVGAAAEATAKDVFVSWLPLYHDMGLIGAWLGSLYFGCLLVLMTPTRFLTRPSSWLRAIHQYGGTLSASPNFGYELCTRRVTDAELAELDLSKWRLAFNGAEPVAPDTLERFQQRFSRCGFKPQTMTPVYGLAEAAVALTLPSAGRGPRIDYVDRKQLSSAGRAVTVGGSTPGCLAFVSCGKPLAGYQLRVVDQGGTEVPERTEGLLQFSGPSATSGYFRNPTATARLLRGDWRDTGDQGYMAAGEVFITGRVKDLIIRRGRHIYPEEIEQAVGNLTGIRKGCVAAFGIGEPDRGTEKLVVVAETHHRDTAVRSRLEKRVMRCVIDCIGEPPEEVILAPPHSVLKTSSGKLRRAATRAAYQERQLGRAPARPFVQMMRLQWEGLALRLRRLREVCAASAFGVYAWLAFGAIAAPVAVMVLLSQEPAAAWRRCHRAAVRLLRAWRIPFAHSPGDIRDLPAPHVLVVNHSSYVDSLFLVALLPDSHVFVVKEELRQAGLLGRILSKLGVLFVNRTDPLRSATETGRLADALREGRSLIVFPEGTFTRIEGLRAFHLGAFQAAAAAGVSVIPVTLHGTRSVLRDGQWLPRRVAVTARVGSPISGPNAGGPFKAALRLRNSARQQILEACAEPDLE